jgi:hypothetical protein
MDLVAALVQVKEIGVLGAASAWNHNTSHSGPALHLHEKIRSSVSTLRTATGLRTKPNAKKEIDASRQEGDAPEANQRAQQ